jgi:hypothetical protein
MPTRSTTDQLARATEDIVEILKQPHPATPFLQQGTVVNDAMKQLTTIFSPPNRDGTAMAVIRQHQLQGWMKPVTTAPRVEETNNNNSDHFQGCSKQQQDQQH